MFYLIGINAIDLFNLKQIVDGRIEYKREKTGKLYSIKVEPEAMEIINRYKGNKFLLNTLETNDYNYRKYMAAMNRGLQKLGNFERKGLGGKKIRDILFPDITSYWARHTWATIAHKIGISKDGEGDKERIEEYCKNLKTKGIAAQKEIISKTAVDQRKKG